MDKDDIKNPFLFQTRYGLAKYINSIYSEDFLQKIQGINYINNSVYTNYIKKLLKENSRTFILFEPSSNFQNVEKLFDSVKKLIYETHFGTEKKVRNPFRNCKTSLEIYNLHRRI